MGSVCVLHLIRVLIPVGKQYLFNLFKFFEFSWVQWITERCAADGHENNSHLSRNKIFINI
jgi:hypothetical protein